jgi:type I restriction enzyme S subunit
MARRLYEEWFVHFHVPGCEGQPLVDSLIGPIPQGWEAKPLKLLARIEMGQSPPSNTYNLDGSGLPFHQGVAQFGQYFPNDKVYCLAKGRLARAGDILVSVRAPVGRINLALSDMIIGRGLSAVHPIDAVRALVLDGLRHFFREEDSIGHGTIYKAIGRRELERIMLPVPPTAFASTYCTMSNSRWELIRNLSLQNRNLRTQRDLVLPKLVSGEIDVSEAERDIREAAE